MRFVCQRGAAQLLVWKQKLSRLSENVTQPYDRSRQISARRSEMLASVSGVSTAVPVYQGCWQEGVDVGSDAACNR